MPAYAVLAAVSNEPGVLFGLTRVLADRRATDTLVNDFAAQWLNLRRLGEVIVHPDFYPSFDESLLQAFKQETEMFVASTLQEDRSVLDLLRADYTFVNERLARHYGIAGIYGSRFRRVALPNPEERGGLLANGALLATTSWTLIESGSDHVLASLGVAPPEITEIDAPRAFATNARAPSGETAISWGFLPTGNVTDRSSVCASKRATLSRPESATATCPAAGSASGTE